jgi:hypothetical protein
MNLNKLNESLKRLINIFSMRINNSDQQKLFMRFLFLYCNTPGLLTLTFYFNIGI